MTNNGVTFLLGFAALILAASTTPNPICKKLPDLKKFNGNESCCELPATLERKAMEECWKEASLTKDSDAAKDCKSMKCLFKRYNLLNTDGKINKAAADDYLKEKFHGNDEWLKVMKPAVDQCMTSVDNDYEKMIQFFNENHIKIAKPEECDMKPTLLSTCVSAKVFAKCPEKSWNQSPACDEWKKYMTTCTDSIENTLEFFKQLEKSGYK